MTGGGYFPGRYFGGRYFSDHYFPNGIETGAGVVAPAFIASSTHVFAPEVSVWVPVTVYIGGGTALAKPKRSFIEQDFEFRWQIQRSVEEAFAFASSIRGLVDTAVEAAWSVEGGIPIEQDMAAAWSVQDLDQRTKNERNMRFLLAEMDEDLAEVFG